MILRSASGISGRAVRRCNFAATSSGRLRCFSASSSTLPATPGIRDGGVALSDLRSQGAFLPKPEVYDERLKSGGRGNRALFIFFLCNAVPFAGLVYYLRRQRAERHQMSLVSLPIAARDVVSEALRVVRTASTCFFLRHGDVGGVLRIDPHLPEATAYVPPTEPLQIMPTMERSAVTDILESPTTSGLGYVHFALSRTSETGRQVLAGERQANLLYVSSTREAYCTISGQLSILADPESRRRYWKSVWARCFPIREAVKAASPSSPADAAAPASAPQTPEPWTSGDYLLLRFAITEVTLHVMVDGAQRWEQRRVRRLEGPDGEDVKSGWALVTPDSA